MRLDQHRYYKWRHDSQILVYLGMSTQGGYWHQFAKVEEPSEVWCEVTDSELELMKEVPDYIPEAQKYVRKLLSIKAKKTKRWRSRSSGKP